jgi:hypothetical protein
MKIKTCVTIILPVVFCGCETWFPSLREEHSLRIFDNVVMRRIFGPEKGKQEARETEYGNLMRNFVTCVLHQISLGLSDQRGRDE